MSREATTTITSDSTATTLFEAGTSTGGQSKDGRPGIELKVQKISGDDLEVFVYPTMQQARTDDEPDAVTLDDDRDTERIIDLSGITKVTAKLASGGTTANIRHTITGVL